MIDAASNLPVVSLYGGKVRPSAIRAAEATAIERWGRARAPALLYLG